MKTEGVGKDGIEPPIYLKSLRDRGISVHRNDGILVIGEHRARALDGGQKVH